MIKKHINKGMHSISTKLVGLITLLIFIIAVSLYITVPHMMLNRSIQLLSQKANSISDMTAYSVRAALDFESIPDIENAFNIARENDDLLYMVLKNRAGEIVYSYNMEYAEQYNYLSAKENIFVGDMNEVYKTYTPISKNDRAIGELYVGLSLVDLLDEIASFRSRLAYGSLLVVLFGIFSAIFISRVVTKPLDKIVKTFDDISKGDLSQRAPVETKDELGQLAESFNLMVESLEFAVNELENSNKNLQLEINERKKAEEELRKLTQAIIQSPVSIMITALDKKIEYVNPKFEQVSGEKAKDVIGRNSQFLLMAERDPEKYNNLWNTIIHGNEWKGEFHSLKEDGSSYWEYISISALTNSDNKVTHFITVKEDITESKKLEETRKRYDFIVNSSKDYMGLLNREFVFEAVNQAFCDILGRSREELVNSPMMEVLGQMNIKHHAEKALFSCFKGEETSVEIEYNFESIGSRFLHITFYPYRNEHNEITHVAIVAKDVTEKHEAEIVLKESEERYRELVSNLPDLVVVHQYGKILFINSAVKEILGYEKDEVMHQSVLNYIAEEYRDKVVETLKLREQGVNVESYEIEMLSRTGERFFMEIRGARIKYDKKPAILNVIVNITERKKLEMQLRKINEQLESIIAERTSELLKVVEQLKKEVDERKVAEDSLRDSEEKFKALAEYSNDVIMRFDRDLKHLYVNKAAERVFGIPVEKFIGKTQKELGFSKVVEKKWTEAVNKVFETSVAYRIEFEYEKEHWIDLIVSPELSSKSKVKTVLTSARDITELKENEIELIKAKEKALESSRLKSEFLANMSHEIRTPMNAILGFTDVLNSYLKENRHKNYLSAIKTAGQSLLTLINDILDLSKIEAGRLELNYEPIDPYSFINEIKNIFSIRIAEKQLEFFIEIEEDLPKSLLLDEVRLRQILFNLIGNAVKFTENGYIKLTMNNVYKDNDRSTVDLILGVEDTGIGIPKGSQQEIFESFRQQEGQNTKKFGGTGLGLAITKRLVEMMGGEIRVKSDVGHGSRFEIVLYNVRAAAAPARPSIEQYKYDEKIKFNKATVLVVDDVEINRRLILEYFPECNLDFIEATDGQDAIEKTIEYSPELILMDIRMPVLNGYEAIKRIRQTDGIKDSIVIAITASAMKEDKQKIDDAGFNGYLMKPVQKFELLGELKKYLAYEVEDSQESESESDTVKEKILSDEERAKLLERFDGDLSEVWEKALNNHYINDAVELADEIISISKKYKVNFLLDYGSELKFHAENFDIEQMEAALKRYSQVIDVLRQK
ncbi:MAG: hypothetical protein SCALA702_23700 [Melioribacteraceae bacterium]|nr:MAG: hypothetical protein SCALA702_23700 [Melioribacteraceae bacterium]